MIESGVRTIKGIYGIMHVLMKLMRDDVNGFENETYMLIVVKGFLTLRIQRLNGLLT